MMATSLTLSMMQIIFFLSGGIVLGVTIHLFMANRKNVKLITAKGGMNRFTDDDWKLKYLHDLETRDNEIAALEGQLLQSRENVKLFSTELYELRWQQNRFEVAKEKLEKKIRDRDKKSNLHHIVMPEKTAKVASR